MKVKDSKDNHGISVLDQKVERYDNTYYYKWKLYFEPKFADLGTVVHARSLNEVVELAMEPYPMKSTQPNKYLIFSQ